MQQAAVDADDELWECINTLTISLPKGLKLKKFKDYLVQELRTTTSDWKRSVFRHKRVIRSEDLPPESKRAFDYIQKMCPTDKHILAILKLIENGPIPGRKISGRFLDTAMTKLCEFRDTTYYLDQTNHEHPNIVKSVNIKGRDIVLFDQTAAYKKNMKFFTKAYFDCFGRGDQTLYTLENGTIKVIILCQFTYYVWAKYHCVFQFIDTEYDNIKRIRQLCQRAKYVPTRRKRKKLEAVESNLNPGRVMLVPETEMRNKKKMIQKKRQRIQFNCSVTLARDMALRRHQHKKKKKKSHNSLRNVYKN